MRKNILLSELLWGSVTFLLMVLVALPIFTRASHFPFWYLLAGAAIILIQFTRLLFLLDQSFLSKSIISQAILLLLCIPAFFFLYTGLTQFHGYLDDGKLEQTINHLPWRDQRSAYNYIRHSVLFLTVGAIIATVSMPVRLLISIWKIYNKKK